jgi:hypothetical protein
MKFNYFKSTLLCTALLSGVSVTAQTPSQFTQPYVYLGRAGINNSTQPFQLFTSPNTTVSNFTGGTALIPALPGTPRLNGIGYNRADNLVYGISFPNAPISQNVAVYRVGANGVMVRLGILNPPEDIVYGTFNTTAGTVDGLGCLWVTAIVSDMQPGPNLALSNLKVYMVRVQSVQNIPTPPGNYGTSVLPADFFELNVSDPALQLPGEAFVRSIINSSNPANATGGLEDMALNPLDGKFYSYVSYPNPADTTEVLGRPISIDMSTLKLSVVGTVINSPSTNGAPDREIAGTYFDPLGNMFMVYTDGQYAQVNLTTGAVTVLSATSPFPLSSANLRGDFASNVSVIPLPVVLNRFTGEVIDKVNKLKWNVGTEENVEKYVVERSIKGKTFDAIGSVEASGESDYSFSDDSKNETPVTYYRLKVVDKNGTYKYSSVLKLSSKKELLRETAVYPTAINNIEQVFIETSSANITVTLTNISGQQFGITHYKGAEGRNIYKMPLPALKTGTYLISVYDATTGNLLHAQRVVKL